MEEPKKEFTDEMFKGKLKRYAGIIGCKGVCLAFQLFYALKNPKLPTWARIRILGALAYLLSFIDAIPDLLPGVGYTDDILVLVAAASTVAFYLDNDVRLKAQVQVQKFFKDCDCGKITVEPEAPSQNS